MHHKHTLRTAVLGALIYLSSDLGTGGEIFLMRSLKDLESLCKEKWAKILPET